MNKVLIAGGAGFLGSTLVKSLLKNDYQVVVLDNLRFGNHTLTKFSNHENFEFQYGDISKESDIEKSIQGCDYVVALAAIVGDKACSLDPSLTHKINFEGTELLITKSIEHNVERFVFASSCSVYGSNAGKNVTENGSLNPLSLYAESQVATEEYLLQNEDKLDFTILRLSTLYGLSERRRYDLVINHFAGKAANGEQIRIIGGEQWRPFLNVEDAATAFLKVIQAKSSDVAGQIFNVGANEMNFQIKEIGQIMKKSVPQCDLVLMKEQTDCRSYHVNFDKIKKVLDFMPKHNLESEIFDMVEDVRTNKIDTHSGEYHNSIAWEQIIKEPYIPYAVPDVSEEEKEEILNTIDSGWLSSGPKVKKFEDALVEYFGKDDLHCITISSCTAALHLQLLANGIGPGDEVITTVNTFCATVIAIIQCGATPVLVDIDASTYNLDLNQVKDKITSKTKAVIPVYYAGNPCNHHQLSEVCAKNGILILADAAHAFGGTFDGQKIGTYEDAASFSFYATKNLTTGEGGLITTKDGKVADKIRKMKSFGRMTYEDKPSYLYEIVEEGYKYNFTDIQASFGLHQLKKIDKFNTYRNKIANYYNEAFKDCPFVTLPPTVEFGQSTNHLYPLQIHFNDLPLNRLDFISALSASKIGLSVNYVPIHHHPYFQQKLNVVAEDFENCNAFFEQEISLPIYTKLKEKDLERISKTILDIVTMWN